MLKKELQELIEKYDAIIKKRILDKKENYRVTWLKKFLVDKNDTENIKLQDFVQYLIENFEPKNALVHFFSDTYLKSNNESLSIFSKLLDESPLSQEELIDYFEQLPTDVRSKEISKHIDPVDIIRLSQTKQALYAETKNVDYWKDKLIEAGCDPEILKKVIMSGAVKDYKNLYRGFTHTTFRSLKPNKAWQLFCLSGEKSAIKYAEDHEGLNKDLMRHFWDNPGQYIAISGNKEGFDYFIGKFGYDKSSSEYLSYMPSIFKSGNVEFIKHTIEDLGFDPYNKFVPLSAIESKSVATVDYMLSLGLYDIKITDHKGRNLLHYAALFGNVPVMKHLITLGFDPKEVSIGDYNILHFAAMSGSIPAMKFAIELGLDPKSTAKVLREDESVDINTSVDISSLVKYTENKAAIEFVDELLGKNVSDKQPKR